jgi:hypothetical protein
MKADCPLANRKVDPTIAEVHVVPTPVMVLPDCEAVPVLYCSGVILKL